MVSKSKIPGKPVIIFLTVGTTRFQFNRLLKAVDKALLSIPFNYKLIAQCGASNYVWISSNVKKYDYIDPPLMLGLIKKADKIITHAGFGSLLLINKYAKTIPFVIPRLHQFYEHVDNHQKHYLNFLREQNKSYIKIFSQEKNLKNAIVNYLMGNTKIKFQQRKIFKRNSKLFIDKFEKIIKSF